LDIKPRVLTTVIDEVDGTASLELALEVAEHFRIKLDAAKNIATEVRAAVTHWHTAAKTFGLSRDEIDRMASAFEYEEPT
jgi:serine/threonine-protein kinase HipA